MTSRARVLFPWDAGPHATAIDGASAVLLLLAGLGFRLPEGASVALAAVLFLGLGRLSLRLARSVLPDENRATTATAALVLLASCWTVVATALGHFGALTPRAVLLVAALALLVSALRPAPPPAPRERTPAAARTAERKGILAAFALFAITTAFAAFSERNAPPGARSFDDTSYHLTAVATWYQWHDLRTVKFPTGDGSTAFYPIAGELFSFLLLVPFDGNDVLARWSEVPFALGSLVALGALARLLRLGDEAAGLAVLLYAASPRVFPTGMLAAGNDHAVCFFVLSSAAGALLLRRNPGPRRAAFLGASLGMLVGTKYTGAMFLPPLLVLAGVCAAGAETGPTGSRRTRSSAALSFLAGAAALLVVGGYVYLRNAVGTGNPFYPATIRAFGRVLLPGWAGDTVGRLWAAGSSGGEALRFLWERVDLLGPLFRWLLLPAAVLAPLVGLVSWAASRVRRAPAARDRSASAAEAVLFALPALLYLTFVRLMADHRDIRYVFAALALAALAVAWLLDRLPPRGARLGRFALLLAVSATLIAGAGSFLLADPRRGAPGFDAAAAFLDRTAPAGTTIAFSGGNQPYLFFGRRLQNRLLYVPAYRGPGAPGLDPPLGASYFSWRGSLEFPRHRVIREEWRENLRQLNVGFVVVVRTGDEFPERDWMAIEPDAFTRVFRDARTEVFAFRDAPSRADRLRVDFARPESDYFVLAAGASGWLLVAPPVGVDLMFPALDAPATSVTLEGTGPGTSMPPIVRLNGRPLDLASANARSATFRIDRSAWRQGRNRLSVLPSRAAESGSARIAALVLALDAARYSPSGGSGELTGNLDVPLEDSEIRSDTLAASGWCRERGGGRIDPVRFIIDGREVVPVRLTRPDRPDVVAVIPALVNPNETGFAVELDVRGLAPGRHDLVVELETPDGRHRTLPARSFSLVR